MKVFQLVCHKCHTKYNLKVEKPEVLADKDFFCKKCGFSMPFTTMVPSLQKYIDAAAPKPSAPIGNNAPVMKTRISNGQPAPKPAPKPAPAKPQVPGSGQYQQERPTYHSGIGLQIAGTSTIIPVPAGRHVLGRNSSDSRANIKLARDPYMSRIAAEMYVTAINGASCAEFMALPSSNKIYINDNYIQPGMMVRLKHGDTILLGMTKVIFLAEF